MERGEFCSEGDFEGTSSLRSGEVWWYESAMRCGDGSGTFTLRAEFDPPPDNEQGPAVEYSVGGTWTLRGGRGYQGLEGGGNYTLTVDQRFETETYDGHVTTD